MNRNAQTLVGLIILATAVVKPTSPLLASIATPPKRCSVQAQIAEAHSTGQGNEILLLKVLAIDQLTDKDCSFMKTGNVYNAKIPKVYQGKTLRVPPLSPNQLKKGDKITAEVFWNYEPASDWISWNILENERSLPKNTSFSTPLTPSSKAK